MFFLFAVFSIVVKADGLEWGKVWYFFTWVDLGVGVGVKGTKILPCP